MRNKNWKYSFWTKTVCWLILVTMACTTAVLGIGIKMIQSNSFYNNSFEAAEKQFMIHEAHGYEDAYTTLQEVVYGYYDENDTKDLKNVTYKITDDNGKVLLDQKTSATKLIQYDLDMDLGNSSSLQRTSYYTVQVTIDASFPYHDRYATWDQVARLLYSMQYSIYFFAAGAFILGIFAFLVLVRGAGRRKEDEEIHTSWIYKIPGDLYVLGWGTLTAAVIGIFGSIANAMCATTVGSICFVGTIFIFGGVMVTICLLNIAVRIKKDGFWKHTFLWWILSSLYGAFGRLGLKARTIWILAGFFFIDLFAIALYNDERSLFLWILRTCVLFGFGIWLADTLKRLLKGTEALAGGNLSYQVSTEKMYGPLKEAGENLNHIAVGMSKAVDDRMKSERMKTALITNVSHDIKTPLTSIINYTDLISKEPCENEKIKEYTAVLTRQSERLKKLIEDLIEASKASTGNLEVILSPCEVNVLLSQAVGEYEEKFQQQDLQLIVKQPEHPVRIMADGRRIWRVFDNLLNNICKYAQSGTRVYLDLLETEEDVEIVFKNTSAQALNISADELKERFVRGDSSRNTEGNGLGLSIAQSLIELQKGTMDLQVDGDLFKVVLIFPKL
jgi:signal transduction histidine kinase